MAGVGIIAWRVGFGRLVDLVVQADGFWLTLVPLAIVLEQLVRAWKEHALLRRRGVRTGVLHRGFG